MDPFTMAMFGSHAIHIPMNMIVQPMGEGKIIGVFQTTNADSLLFGSKMTHQLVMGDVVIRPHLVMESDALAGRGVAGLLTHGFMDTEAWLKGNIILDQFGKLKKKKT